MAGNPLDHHHLHPEPRHIYRLWKTYTETVDPLIKFVHVPTLQQRILDASWNPSNVAEPLAATMFAVYSLAITSMSPHDCEAAFGEPRGRLIIRYRTGTIKALIAADVFVTRNFEVLQALLLLLYADPESSLSLTLVSVAVKLGKVLGLHKESTDPKLSFFDKEMRIRFWWQLRSLEVRANAPHIPLSKMTDMELGELRLPLNVNDVDLHPDMKEPPVEHKGPTEMLYPLMKFEPTIWIRSSPLGAKLFETMRKGPARDRTSMAVEEEAVNEMGRIFSSKYLASLDDNIPLHWLGLQMGRRAGAAVRFKIHHLRARVSPMGSDVYLPQQDLDLLFESSIIILEIAQLCDKMKFSPHLVTHMSARVEVDAFIHMVSDLRERVSGPQVDRAWQVVEWFCNDYPRITDDVEDPFYMAVGDLILEAWASRSRELLKGDNAQDHSTPHFISRLRQRRDEDSNKATLQTSPSFSYLDNLESLTSMEVYDHDENYWSAFMQF